MTENVEFTPEQQAKVDEIVKSRVARERERWEKESGVEELRQQLASKDEEIAEIRGSHWRETTERLIRETLSKKGIVEEGRQNRVMRLLDWDALAEREGNEYHALRGQLEALSKDVPELVDPQQFRQIRGRSDKPVLAPEKPITREELESMGPDEVNRRWPSVREFLSGQRP